MTSLIHLALLLVENLLNFWGGKEKKEWKRSYQKRCDVKVTRSKAQKKRQEVFAKRTDKSYRPCAGLNAGIQGKRKREMEGDGKCKCGSSSHKRTTHKDCPMNKKREKSNNDASHHKTLPLDRQAVIDDTKDADVEHHTTEILVYANGPCNKTPRVGWNPPMSALN
jgi:hypothetical protein